MEAFIDEKMQQMPARAIRASLKTYIQSTASRHDEKTPNRLPGTLGGKSQGTEDSQPDDAMKIENSNSIS